MSSLPEHLRITLPRVAEIEAESRLLKAQIAALGQERRSLIDSEAQKIAKLAVGQEMDVSYGYGRRRDTRRYRIIEVGGDYNLIDQLPDEDGFLWVKYRGRLIKKDGTFGEDERTLYPEDCKLIVQAPTEKERP